VLVGKLIRLVVQAGRACSNLVNSILNLTYRQWLVVIHDIVATAAAIVASFWLRFGARDFWDRSDQLLPLLPGFLLYAAVVYWVFHLYKSKWRFTSLPDLSNIVRAVFVLAISLLVLDYVLVAPNFLGAFFFGKLTIILYWFLQIFFLGGSRIAYRYFRYSRTRQRAMAANSAPILVLGRAADAEVLLRAIESGAVKKIWPVGILSPSPADQGQSVRGVSVMGTLEDLESVVGDFAARERPIGRIVLTPSALEPTATPEAIVMKAKRLGLTASRLPSLDEGGEAVRLSPVKVEDLLLRPSVAIDYRRLEHFVAGKSIVVTGGGGSIGGEICDRIAPSAPRVCCSSKVRIRRCTLSWRRSQPSRRTSRSKGAWRTCVTARASPS
jgi:FlaA1/EpsC-like NDP-sugar epimerase